MNLITSAEAQFLYASLGGENPSVSAWNRLTLPQKIFITQLMGEIGKKLNKGGAG